MAFATVTRYDEDTWHYVEPKALSHGDLVARVTENGPVAPRVVLKPNGKAPALLGYPKRMTQVEGDGALLGNYVDEDGMVLVIGHVTEPVKAAPKGKASKSPAKHTSAKPTQDTTPDTTPATKGTMTKASAADALDALAIAVKAVADALR